MILYCHDCDRDWDLDWDTECPTCLNRIDREIDRYELELAYQQRALEAAFRNSVIEEAEAA